MRCRPSVNSAISTTCGCTSKAMPSYPMHWQWDLPPFLPYSSSPTRSAGTGGRGFSFLWWWRRRRRRRRREGRTRVRTCPPRVRLRTRAIGCCVTGPRPPRRSPAASLRWRCCCAEEPCRQRGEQRMPALIACCCLRLFLFFLLFLLLRLFLFFLLFLLLLFLRLRLLLLLQRPCRLPFPSRWTQTRTQLRAPILARGQGRRTATVTTAATERARVGTWLWRPRVST